MDKTKHTSLFHLFTESIYLLNYIMVTVYIHMGQQIQVEIDKKSPHFPFDSSLLSKTNTSYSVAGY